MRSAPTFLALLLIVPLMLGALSVAPANAAVQLGMHMDFVLSNGTTVRVFPSAEDTTTDNLHPRWAQPPDLPAQAEDASCDELERRYDERIGRVRDHRQQAQMRPVAPAQRPAWLRSVPKLRAVVAVGGVFSAAPKPSDWYYLPTEPKLSYADERPEATFVKFITDEEEGPDSAAGGIFHMMMSYGLTRDEEAELRTTLEEAVPGARLRGMVELTPAATGENFVVTSGTLSDTSFTPAGVLKSGKAPTYPGGKAALAGRLSPIGAELLASTFENATSDLSVTFAYDYIAKTRAFNAEVRINLDRVRKLAECSYDAQTVTRSTKKSWGFIIIPYYTESESIDRISREQYEHTYDVLRTTGAVTITIDQNLPDVDVSFIEQALMDQAMESFMEIQRSFSMPGAEDIDTSGDDEDDEDERPANTSYEILTIRKKRESMSGQIAFKVTKSMAVYRSHTMTGNLGAQLRDHEDEVFSTVLLNDPFFRRGRVVVDLDADALDLFEAGMVNNVAVQVTPGYAGANRRDKVFDRATVETGDVVETFTFATGGQELNARCPIRYSQSWSLRGGGKWPPDTEENCTREMNITLVPPIEARDVEVEADLDEFERLGIRAVDVLLRHSRYGKEEIETVKFRVARPAPYVETRLFVDKGDPERTPVHYSLVFTHKEEGQLPASPWRLLEGDFAYASVSGLPDGFARELGERVDAVRDLFDGSDDGTN